ncbi:AAA family ATPase [Pyxidicoccus xibeiensis]|uniref:AAA family ATPase n=1 Tax=Pyxidicoccus xibeiensis TaxID=2906759 RepID=UPI0020A83336|nr:AAA family ATPase [Pyxidicoccus xibeiensis]MCP3143428.1 AAA family ATPase [Pyxidicoccus xibeiensis]
MLSALEIENFKGIASSQRIDFASLTLLFGANSAGKSTVLQALLYLHEVLEHGNADVDRTELGGSVLELGGFARLVHRHESNRAIVLKAEFATPGNLERFGRDLTGFPFPDLDDEVESAWLELTIRHRTTTTYQGPLVESAVIGVAGAPEPLVWLETGTSLREGEPLNVRVNLEHPLIAEPARDVEEGWAEIAVPQEVLHRAMESEGGGHVAGSGLRDGSGFGHGRSQPVFAVSRSRRSALPPVDEPLRVIAVGDDTEEKVAVAAQVRIFLEMVVLGTIAQLLSSLRDALYIGPLRTVPPRGFLYERAGRLTSWADGLAAWELLLADRGTLVERTNTWLKRLGAGCQVVVQQLFEHAATAEELSAGHVDKTVRRLLLDTGVGNLVLPSEVGAGISQVLPVVVAALEGRGGLSLVEQPEIHVHPAVQVGLGDLYSEAATREGSRRTVLVETHSEHLILRLLRRIRETTEKTLPEGAPAFSADMLSVLYVESTPEGVRIRRLRVDEHGEFLDSWPRGFFDERFAEVYGS